MNYECESLLERMLNWLNRQMIPITLHYLAISIGVNNCNGFLNALLFKFVGALTCIIAIPFSGLLGMLLSRECKMGLSIFGLFPVGEHGFYVTLALVPFAIVLSRWLTKLMSSVHNNVKFKIAILSMCLVTIVVSVAMAKDSMFCKQDEYAIIFTFTLWVCWFFGRSEDEGHEYYFPNDTGGDLPDDDGPKLLEGKTEYGRRHYNGIWHSDNWQ